MLKTLATFAVLALTTGAALASPDCGMTRADDRQAMTCLPGTAWDDLKATCVPVTTS